ncbi:MAG: DUF2958 domain-containing protein [Phycisphaerae bacterium]|nr:DUF2958 domain-containing protein [Phycisphaerae bacterium]
MKLLTEEIKAKLPKLYAQDGKGGKAIVHAKFFMPTGSWSWYVLEGDIIKNDDGSEDALFFGLVDGFEKELGYFNLKELEAVKGPLGLPIERDLHWQPKALEEIMPELFKD